MKILIDMNLSPLWVDFFQQNNYKAAHWSSIGHPMTPDEEIFEFAKNQNWLILTGDLDFGTKA